MVIFSASLKQLLVPQLDPPAFGPTIRPPRIFEGTKAPSLFILLLLLSGPLGGGLPAEEALDVRRGRRRRRRRRSLRRRRRCLWRQRRCRRVQFALPGPGGVGVEHDGLRLSEHLRRRHETSPPVHVTPAHVSIRGDTFTTFLSHLGLPYIF